MSKKRIGFVSYWGFARGLAYGTLIYAKMLKDEYDIFILKQGTNPIAEEFKTVDVDVTEYPSYVVDKETFANWIIDNNLDAVVFNEYGQWVEDKDNLPNLAKNLGCRVYGYLVMERFHSDQTLEYDRIIAPTASYVKFMRANKVRHFTYIPHSVDFKEFSGYKKMKNEKFVFFHPGGYGGVKDRKNTDAVVQAFLRLDNPDTELIITSQKPLKEKYAGLSDRITVIDEPLSRDNLLKFYFQADAVVLPSKWETVGLPIIESLAAAVPVITTDIPPMNEFIRVGMNGYLCSPDMVTYSEIAIKVAEVSPLKIKTNMENIMNKDIYPMLAKNAKYVAEKLYNLENNKHYFLDFLKEDLK